MRSMVSVSSPVVGQQAADRDSKTGVVRDRCAQERSRRVGRLVGGAFGETDSAVVVDGHMDTLPAGTVGVVAWITGDSMTRPHDPA